MSTNKQLEHEVNSVVRTWTKILGYILLVFALLAGGTLLLPILPSVWFGTPYFSFGKVFGLLASGFISFMCGLGLLVAYMEDKNWE